MKKFLKFIGLLLFIIIFQLYFFDTLYNQIYDKGVARDKIKWIRSMEIKDTIDYVLLGSSRCIYHLQPEILDKISGLKGLNLGYAASGPIEIKLMLKEVLKKADVKRVFIQVDHQYNQDAPDKLASVSWMPYMNEEIFEEFKPHGFKYSLLKYVPFYKYQVYDPQIGFRNVLLVLLRKEADFIKEKGFKATTGEEKGELSEKYIIEDVENPILKEVIKICENKNIDLIFYTSPVFKNTTDYSIIKKYLPNYYDLSGTITDRKFFRDAAHLNGEGARIFTELFYEKVVKN